MMEDLHREAFGDGLFGSRQRGVASCIPVAARPAHRRSPRSTAHRWPCRGRGARPVGSPSSTVRAHLLRDPEPVAKHGAEDQGEVLAHRNLRWQPRRHLVRAGLQQLRQVSTSTGDITWVRRHGAPNSSRLVVCIVLGIGINTRSSPMARGGKVASVQGRDMRRQWYQRQPPSWSVGLEDSPAIQSRVGIEFANRTATT
jgi:hypothetical protein